MNKQLKYLIAAWTVCLAGAAYIITRPTPLERRITETNTQFIAGDYENHKAFAGYNNEGMKVAKVYSDIQRDINGNNYLDLIAVADMNQDGLFQADELVDSRYIDTGERIIGASPTKNFGGTVSNFANPQTLEKVFAKLMLQSK